MKIECKTCGATGSSKCPELRRIFPGRAPGQEQETNFFSVFGMEMVPSKVYKDTRLMRVSMTVFDEEVTESEAFISFVQRVKSIPDEYLARYACVHRWSHTEDCKFCYHKMEESK